MPKRCAWARDTLMVEYHDREWGVPLHDNRKLFELLTLEGAQAGLSWSTILRRRENYRRAFDDFDPEKIAKYTQRDVGRLMRDEGIVRNRLKILSVINNAKRFLEVKKEFGSFYEDLFEDLDGSEFDFMRDSFAEFLTNRLRSQSQEPGSECLPESRDKLAPGESQIPRGPSQGTPSHFPIVFQ